MAEYFDLVKKVCLEFENQDEVRDAKKSEMWIYLLDLGAGTLELDNQDVSAPVYNFLRNKLDVVSILRTAKLLFSNSKRQ